jgi:hypothetical protein
MIFSCRHSLLDPRPGYFGLVVRTHVTGYEIFSLFHSGWFRSFWLVMIIRNLPKLLNHQLSKDSRNLACIVCFLLVERQVTAVDACQPFDEALWKPVR